MFCWSLVSNHRARSDPTHQHFGHSLHGHHLQNSYTQTGSFHIINDGIMANSSTANSGLHQIACSSAMDCESPVTSTTGLALNYHNSRFQSKAWAPITPSNSLTSPPNSLTSPTIYHHSSHHMRLNNISHQNSNSSNSQHSHHSRTGAVSSGFRTNRHLHHTPQHTPSVPSIGKSHQQLQHSTPSLQVAAISSSCPSATSTSSQHSSSTIAIESLSQLQKSDSVTSPGSSVSLSDFPVPMDTAGVLMPAFIQPPQTFQSMGTMGSFQPLAYSSSGQSLFIGTGFQINSTPNASSGTAHAFSQVPHPSLGSPAVTSSTLGQQQRQANSLVESVLRRSRQSYNDDETDRDESSPMVHDHIGQSISRPSHWQ